MGKYGFFSYMPLNRINLTKYEGGNQWGLE